MRLWSSFLHSKMSWWIVVVGLVCGWTVTGMADENKAGKNPPTTTAEEPVLSPSLLQALSWRCIGPANMGGRITAISVFEADPTTFYVATASGGLLKTTNNGITFEHQFDRQRTVSIGDVCVAPSDRNIVWVGTGEANPRNSVSYGDGVYKSTDGGKTWRHMGLKNAFQIGKILIHPTNPDIVYVGVLGRLYGPSEERGLYKTTDGGKTWTRILYVDDKTGVIDMRMHPYDPDTLLVATYERQRDGFDGGDPVKKYGPGSGLYKTTDGGRTFRRITKGLPTCKLGRIGLDYFRTNPNIVYAVIESEKIGMGRPPRRRPDQQRPYMGIRAESAEKGALLTEVVAGGPAEKAGLEAGDVIVAIGKTPIASYDDLIDRIRSAKVGEKVRIKVRRGKETKEIDFTFGTRQAGSSQRPNGAALGGQMANVQNTQGPDGHEYGGVYRSDDGGESWKRINSLNPRPMYFSQIRVDPSDNRYLYVLGISLHRSIDGGNRFTSDGGRGAHPDHHALWIDPRDGRHMILGCDGGVYVTYDRGQRWDHLNHAALGQFYHVGVDARRDYWVFGGLQDNGSWGGPSFTKDGVGPINADWVRVGGGDGFTCVVDPNDHQLVYVTSQYGGMRRVDLRTGRSVSIRPRPRRGQRFRFNWKTPFILSHHNSRIFYCAGNYVFRSLDRGNNLQIISPEITATKRGSGTAIAESPRNPNVLYVGTDDGSLWVTRDGGQNWINITKNVPLPGPRWVATIEASRFADGRAYVAFDAHRSDDDNPYLFVTEDFGASWRSIRANLPWGSTRCLREDAVNPDLLYVGTEFGAWFTLDRGRRWISLNTNLPTVAVHEIAVHPTVPEIVAATHGRSLWILDVTALRQIKPDQFLSQTQLYKPATAIRWRSSLRRGGTNRRFVGTNPPGGAQLYYSLAKKAKEVGLRVLDINGRVVWQAPTRGRRARPLPADCGLHRISWNLTEMPRRSPAAGFRRFGFARRGRPVTPGTYRVILTVDGKEYTQLVEVAPDPSSVAPLISEEQGQPIDTAEEPTDW